MTDEIPPFISVKKGSYILFTKDDAERFCAGVDIYGMMNLTKRLRLQTFFHYFSKPLPMKSTDVTVEGYMMEMRNAIVRSMI